MLERDEWIRYDRGTASGEVRRSLQAVHDAMKRVAQREET
jgi:hypothetical protein